MVKDEFVPLFSNKLLTFAAASALNVISALEPVISKSLEQSEEIVVVPDTSSQAYDTLENVEINKDKVIINKITIKFLELRFFS